MPDETKPTELEKPSFLAVFKSLVEDGILDADLDADLTSDLVDPVHRMRAHAHATGSNKIFADAFSGIVAKVRAGCDVTVSLGEPES